MWTQLEKGKWKERKSHVALMWKDKIFLIGGFEQGPDRSVGDVWILEGDSGWELVLDCCPWSGRDGHSSIIFNNECYVIGGTDDSYYCKNDVWKSGNGFDWECVCHSANFEERWQHATVVHNNFIYVIGGWGQRHYSDVWKSDDGITWNEVSKYSPWSPRKNHCVISFHEYIFILGGNDGNDARNDIWASIDGNHWMNVCSHANWSPRQGFAVTILGEYIYIVGGTDGINFFDDMWRSRDGVIWTLVSQGGPWSARASLAAVAYRDALYVIGGVDEHGCNNDTYKLPIDESFTGYFHNQLEEYQFSDHCSTTYITDEKTSSETRPTFIPIPSVLTTISKLKDIRFKNNKLLNSLSIIITTVNAVLYQSNGTIEKSLEKLLKIIAINNNIYQDSDDTKSDSTINDYIDDSDDDDDNNDHHHQFEKITKVEKVTVPVITTSVTTPPPPPPPITTTTTSKNNTTKTRKTEKRNFKNNIFCLYNYFFNYKPKKQRNDSFDDRPLPPRLEVPVIHRRRKKKVKKQISSDSYLSQPAVLPLRKASSPVSTNSNKNNDDNDNNNNNISISELDDSSGISLEKNRILMDSYKIKLNNIQKEIRQFAESQKKEHMEELITQRTLLASDALEHSKLFYYQIETTQNTLESRLLSVTKTLTSLDDLAKSLGMKFSSPSSSSSFSSNKKSKIDLNTFNPMASLPIGEEKSDVVTLQDWESFLSTSKASTMQIDSQETNLAIRRLFNDLVDSQYLMKEYFDNLFEKHFYCPPPSSDLRALSDSFSVCSATSSKDSIHTEIYDLHLMSSAQSYLNDTSSENEDDDDNPTPPFSTYIANYCKNHTDADTTATTANNDNIDYTTLTSINTHINVNITATTTSSIIDNHNDNNTTHIDNNINTNDYSFSIIDTLTATSTITTTNDDDNNNNNNQIKISPSISSIQTTIGSIPFSEKFETQFKKLEKLENSNRMTVISKCNEEYKKYESIQDELPTVLQQVINRSRLLLSSVLYQLQMDNIEISNLMSEVQYFLALTNTISHLDGIRITCTDLIEEISEQDQKLIDLEAQLIDAKAKIQKAFLYHSRRFKFRTLKLLEVDSYNVSGGENESNHSSNRTINSTPTTSIDDDDNDDNKELDNNSLLKSDILSNTNITPLTNLTTTASASATATAPPHSTHNEKQLIELKEYLLQAECAVRTQKRAMRLWLREKRKYALAVAPELFFYLQDLRYPGSLLGDGGYANWAKIPLRKIEDYDLISNINTSNNIIIRKTDKYIICMANLEQDVLIKGYFAQDQIAYLKGFEHDNIEKEIQILTQLNCNYIIKPRAILEGSIWQSEQELRHISFYIEYPLYRNNLMVWMTTKPKLWEKQSIARQLLCGISYLHDHSIIHQFLVPENIQLTNENMVVITGFENCIDISDVLYLERRQQREEEDHIYMNTTTTTTTTSKSNNSVVDEEYDDSLVTSNTNSLPVTTHPDERFLAPELRDHSDPPSFGSDMYSFGALLFYMHFPTHLDGLIPGFPVIPPPEEDTDLSNLLLRLLRAIPTHRPSATSALLHAYFHNTYEDRLIQEGEIVQQDDKLEAVRTLVCRIRAENRTNIDHIVVHRSPALCVKEMLQYFKQSSLHKLKAKIRVSFVGEENKDQEQETQGETTNTGIINTGGSGHCEMFYLFFEAMYNGYGGLFDSQPIEVLPNLMDDVSNTHTSITTSNTLMPYVLPVPSRTDSESLQNYKAFGRAMVKTLYEGRRMGGRLAPSVFKYLVGMSPDLRDMQLVDPTNARKLQFILNTPNIEKLQLPFDVQGHGQGQDLDHTTTVDRITDNNKVSYIRIKIQHMLVDSRKLQLESMKSGFLDALQELSGRATPFLTTMLSPTDWRVMLCGDIGISGHQVVKVLEFTGFNTTKKNIPQWLKEIIISFSDDHLRKFLVFVTGNPSLPWSAINNNNNPMVIRIRYQALSQATLPIAHICYFQLDLPDYPDKVVLAGKLLEAICQSSTLNYY